MEYTNSPLVVYTALSPNHSGLRNHAIDRITPHCVVGQLSVEVPGNSPGQYLSARGASGKLQLRHRTGRACSTVCREEEPLVVFLFPGK